MNLKIKKDEDSGDCYIDVEDLRDLFEDVSVIEYYEMTENEDGYLVLQFFDKNANVVVPLDKK